jgi:hypothetical protein
MTGDAADNYVRYGFPPCLGCGYCCQKVRCPIGIEQHGVGDNCPSLIFDAAANRFWCTEVQKNPKLRVDLNIGDGCCSSLNSQRAAKARELKNTG